METDNKNTDISSPQKETAAGQFNNSGRIMGGLLIVVVGLIWLAEKAGFMFPEWLLSFETFLIAVGLYLGFRHSFKGFAWIIPILIGGFLLLDDLYLYDFGHFFWPAVVIGVGLFIIAIESILRYVAPELGWR